MPAPIHEFSTNGRQLRQGSAPVRAAWETAPAVVKRAQKLMSSSKGVPEETIVSEEGDIGTRYKLEALASLHERKVAALMRSISVLRDEISRLKAESKEHRRSSLIQNLRKKLKEQELVVDVLKETLVEGRMTEDQVNELIIVRTLGGPKRFRPKAREELQNELAEARRKLDAMKSTMPSQQTQENHTDLQLDQAETTSQPLEETKPKELEQVLPSAEHLREVSALATQVEEARVSAARYELQLAESRRCLEAMRAEVTASKRELAALEHERERSQELQSALQESRLARERAEHSAASRLGELEALRLQVEHTVVASAAEQEALKAELENLGHQLISALQVETQLRQSVSIERERAARAENREESVKTQAEARLQAAEHALRNATKSRDNLQTALIQRVSFFEEQADTNKKEASTEAKVLEADRRRESLETKRRVDAERTRAERFLHEKRQAENALQNLRLELDKVRAELRVTKESQLDESTRFEAERLTLTEKVGALETALARRDGTEQAGLVYTEVQIDRVAHRAARDKSRFAAIEESVSKDRAARVRAESLEAQSVAARAAADRRLAQARDEIESLRKKLQQLERRDSAAASQRQHAQQQQKALSDNLRSLEGDHEATRQALLAHMRLADVYATVHDRIAATTSKTIDAKEAKDTRAALAKARNELNAALALSPRLSAFYDSVLSHIRDRRRQHEMNTTSSLPHPSHQKIETPVQIRKSPKREQYSHSLPEPLFIREHTASAPPISSLDDQFSRDADGLVFDEHITKRYTTPPSTVPPPQSKAHTTTSAKEDESASIILPSDSNSIGSYPKAATNPHESDTALQDDLASIDSSDNSSSHKQQRPPFTRIGSIGDDSSNSSSSTRRRRGPASIGSSKIDGNSLTPPHQS